MLGEFGRGDAGRRAYVRFVHAGMEEPPPSPFAGAKGGLLVGSAQFVERMRKLLGDRPADAAVPQLKRLRRRPPLAKIAGVTAKHFGSDPASWTIGRRCDDAGRTVAAYLARRRFGYSAAEVAHALGYRSHGSVRNALLRVEAGGRKMQNAIANLEGKLH